MEAGGERALLTAQGDEVLCKWQEHSLVLGGTPRKQALSATAQRKPHQVEFHTKGYNSAEANIGEYYCLVYFDCQNDSSPLVYGLTFLFCFRRLNEMEWSDCYLLERKGAEDRRMTSVDLPGT